MEGPMEKVPEQIGQVVVAVRGRFLPLDMSTSRAFFPDLGVLTISYFIEFMLFAQ